MAMTERTARTATSDKAARPAARFERKRQTILDAATVLINRNGVKGLTFVEVGEMVGLSTTSITYYFRLKEQLASAAFEQTLERIEAIVREAGAAPTPVERVSRYLELYIDAHRRICRREERPFADLSDIRALDSDVRQNVSEHYTRIFRQIRDFFGPIRTEVERTRNTARALVLAECVYWFPLWLGKYASLDFARVGQRVRDIFLHGLAPAGGLWKPRPLAVERRDIDSAQANFLRTATRLVNDLGYRGASVERIVAELNVTKGSFYHHLDAKDDLILECFRISLDRIQNAQAAAAALDGSHGERLISILAALLEIQLIGDWPLQRTTALRTLPPEVRADVVARSDQVALHFAGLIADGIADGSVRPVDPGIAGQMIMSSLNAACELHRRATALGNPGQAVELYASTLYHGLFDDQPRA